MKASPYVLALAAMMMVPGLAAAQAERASSDRQTATNPRGTVRPPVWGFTVGMRPGPNNAYTHPYVHTVVEGSNAERAGLQVDDVILSVNGRDASQPPLFPVREAGTRYTLRVRRGQEELELVFIYPETSRNTPLPRSNERSVGS
jgi:S1-C subfamily serine protease